MDLNFIRIKFLELKAIFLFYLLLLIFINLGFAIFFKNTEILIKFIFILFPIFCNLIYKFWSQYSNINILNLLNSLVMFIKQLNILIYFFLCFLSLVFLLTCWDVFSQLFRFDEMKDFLMFYVFLFSNISLELKRFSFLIRPNFRMLSMFAFRHVSEYSSSSSRVFTKSRDLSNMDRSWSFKPIGSFDIGKLSNIKEFIDEVNNATDENENSSNFFKNEYLHKIWIDNYFGCRDLVKAENEEDQIKFAEFKKYLKKDAGIIDGHPGSLFEIDGYCTKILLPHTSKDANEILVDGLDLSTLKFEKGISVRKKSFQGINSYSCDPEGPQYFFSNLVKLLWVKKQITVGSSFISEELEPSMGLQLSAFNRNQEFIDFLGCRKEQLYPLLVELNKGVSIKEFQEIAIFAEKKYGFKMVDCSHTVGFGKSSPVIISIENLD